MAPPSATLFLLGALILAFAAITAIVGRLFREWWEGTLTTKTLLVGGFLFSGIFGLALACLQTLINGPAL